MMASQFASNCRRSTDCEKLASAVTAHSEKRKKNMTLLYNSPVAPNPRRVRIFLAEKGISLPMQDVDLAKFEQRELAFQEINPLQAVPALMLDDGEVLTESVAICRYFERQYPQPPLFGVGARDEAFVDMWQRRLEFGLFATIGLAFRHSHPAMAQMENPQFPDFAEVQRGRAVKFMRFLDGELTKRRFVACDEFTIADITGLVAMDLAKFARVDVPPELTHLARWWEDVSSRPSAKA
jgi:glutathione S-transferase